MYWPLQIPYPWIPYPSLDTLPLNTPSPDSLPCITYPLPRYPTPGYPNPPPPRYPPPQGTWYQGYPIPLEGIWYQGCPTPSLWTNRRLWKHNLPLLSVNIYHLSIDLYKNLQVLHFVNSSKLRTFHFVPHAISIYAANLPFEPFEIESVFVLILIWFLV